jgi:hypothetical protein
MTTAADAPGAAKFRLNWPTTDVNITARIGASFLAFVCHVVKECSWYAALPDSPNQVQDQLLLQQWREIEVTILTLYYMFLITLVGGQGLQR